MKINKLIVFALASAFCIAWQFKPVNHESEIADMEKAFVKMAAEKGIAEAFYQYAADDAVIKRENDTLIKGRENIRNYYAGKDLKHTSLTWSPDFISVSADGSMAYTYGSYVWKAESEKGKSKVYTGIFHTVWKRQANGQWKYVWD